MLGAAVIVLRETLEAALLIGIVAAATRTISGYRRWICSGVFLGLAGACVIAGLTRAIAELFDGIGQELLNAVVLGVAAILLGWHQIWMTSHGAALASDAKQIGQDIREGRRALPAILIVVALAVLREGAESAIFLYGAMSSGDIGITAVAAGGALGLAAGFVLGFLLYAGLLRIPMHRFFSVTSVLILLIAAGMASRMAKFLVQADILRGMTAPIWDTSAFLPVNSTIGIVMQALAGYDPSPAGIQAVFYVSTLIVILCGMRWVRSTNFVQSR